MFVSAKMRVNDVENRLWRAYRAGLTPWTLQNLCLQDCFLAVTLDPAT